MSHRLPALSRVRLLTLALVTALLAAGATVGLAAPAAHAAPPPPRDTQVVRVLDSTGTPIEGAVVNLQTAPFQPSVRAATAADGTIDLTTLPGLQAGVAYELFVWADGFADYWDGAATGPDSQAVVPTVGAPQLDVQLPVTNPPVGPTVAGISGTVTDALTGAPIIGVQVLAQVAGGGTGVGNSQTAADGTYLLGYTGDFASNQATVTFTPLLSTPDAPYGYPQMFFDGITWQSTNETPVTVTPNSTTGGINAAIVPFGQLTGRVVAVSGSTLVPAEAQVTLLDPATGIEVASGFTDTNGDYAFPADPGSWIVRFQQIANGNVVATQYYDGATDLASATPITITATESTGGIDAQFGTLPVTPVTPPIAVLPATGPADAVPAASLGLGAVLLGAVAFAVRAGLRRRSDAG